MDYVRYALDEAKRLAAQEDAVPVRRLYSDHVRFLQQRRERYYRRLMTYLSEFSGLPLKTDRKLLVENRGSATIFPCIRLCEEVSFPADEHPANRFFDGVPTEKRFLVDIFIEITEDGLDSRVQCRAECLWLEQTMQMVSSDPENLMKSLARQMAELLKVDELLGSGE